MNLLCITGAAIGFWGHRNWTFSYVEDWRSVNARYIVAHCLGYLINLLLLYGLVDRLGYFYRLVELSLFIVAGFLFLVFKFFVFSKFKRCRRSVKRLDFYQAEQVRFLRNQFDVSICLLANEST